MHCICKAKRATFGILGAMAPLNPPMVSPTGPKFGAQESSCSGVWVSGEQIFIAESLFLIKCQTGI